MSPSAKTAEPATPQGDAAPAPNPFLPVGVALDERTRLAVADLWKKLTAPFPEAEVEWLLKEGDVFRNGDTYVGRCFAYVTARAIQQRLDDIFGPYWSTRMQPTNFGSPMRVGMVCELSVFVPAIGWLTKTDAADLSTIDPVRGGASGALKRVAVQFGIGRYLYYLPEGYAKFHAAGSHRIRVDGRTLPWDPPLLPPWALPEKERPAREQLLKEREAAAAAEAAAKAEAAKAAAALAAATPPPTPPAADVATTPAAEKPATTAKDTAPTQAGTPHVATGGLAADAVKRLRAIFGENEVLSVTYLKHKGLLPSGATSYLQLPVSNAEILLKNAGHVTKRMKRLFAVARIVANRDDAATTYFVGRGLVQGGEPWYAASDESLDKAIAAGDKFSRLLTKLTSGAIAA